MSRLSLKIQMVVVPLFMLVVFIGFTAAVLVTVVNQMVDDKIEEQAAGDANLASIAQESFEKQALMAAAMAAGVPTVVPAYELAAQGKEDAGRVMLRKCFDSIHARVADILKIKQFRIHFHLPPAKSFLRIWRRPGQGDGGDDLSSFRRSVLKVNRDRAPLTGIEFGRGGFVIRGIAPVVAPDGRRLGSVECLVDFRELVDSALTGRGKAAAVYMLAEDLKTAKRLSAQKMKKIGRFLRVTTTLKESADDLVTPDALESGFKAPWSDLRGDTLLTAFPIKNFLGEVKGVLLFGADFTEINARKTGLTYAVIGGGVFIMLVLGGYFLLTNRRILASLGQVLELAREISDRNLTGPDLDDRDRNEIGRMAGAINGMKNSLIEYTAEIRESAQNIAQQTEGIADGNQDLSRRTQSQSAAIEEISASIQDITSSVKSTASSAGRAKDLASETADLAQEGGRVLKEAVVAVSEVSDSSKKINEIVDMVNEIAFQTNLLALNAAVEAARAGEAGRGFAVVAGEVRTLAVKSSEAAKEIQQLIQESVARVDRGNTLVSDSGRIIERIIERVQSVEDRVTSITRESQQQATAIDEAGRAVSDIDNNIQQTAALVDQTTQSSQAIREAVTNLERMIGSFRLPRSEIGLLTEHNRKRD